MSSTLNMDIHANDPKVLVGNAGTQIAQPCSGDAELKRAMAAMAVRIAAVEAIVNKPVTPAPTQP